MGTICTSWEPEKKNENLQNIRVKILTSFTLKCHCVILIFFETLRRKLSHEHETKEKLKDETDEDELKVRNVALRYNMWSYMQYEIIVLREYTAIAYYWVKGWI